MARFRSQSLTLLRQIFATLLLLIFIITIHPSYGDGDADEGEPMPLLGMDLVILVCNHTSHNKFCVDYLSHSEASVPSAKAGEIANCTLRFGQGRADAARRLIASILQTSPAQKIRQILQRCQLLNDKAIEYLMEAGDNLNSDSPDSMVEDLNDAANATRSCQDIIQGTNDFSVLANKNSDVIKFCEICVVARKFFTEEDFN